MPIRLNSFGGGSVTVDVPSTVLNTTLTLPALTGTIITSASNADINASALTTGTVSTDRFASGTVVQTARKVWDSWNGTLSWSGNYNWQGWTASDITVTARRANSLWVVWYTFPMATRSSATSSDIWFSVSGAAFNTLSGQSTAGGSESGSYGISTIWDSGSTDIWMGATINAANVLTHVAGASITFRVYGRNGGPGTENTSGTQSLGHPLYNAIGVVQEIAQ